MLWLWGRAHNPARKHGKSSGSSSSSGGSSCQDEAFSETWSDDRHDDDTTSTPPNEERKLLSHSQQPRSLPINPQHYSPLSSSPQQYASHPPHQVQPHIVADHIITMHTQAPQLSQSPNSNGHYIQSNTLGAHRYPQNNTNKISSNYTKTMPHPEQYVVTRPGGRVRMSSCVDSCIWEETPTFDMRESQPLPPLSPNQLKSLPPHHMKTHTSPSHYAPHNMQYPPNISKTPPRAATLDRHRPMHKSESSSNFSQPTSLTLGRVGSKSHMENLYSCASPNIRQLNVANNNTRIELPCNNNPENYPPKIPINQTNNVPQITNTTIANENLNKSISSQEDSDKVRNKG